MRWGWIALLVVAGLAGGWHWWASERPVARVPGIVAANDPVQQTLDPPPSPASAMIQSQRMLRMP